MNAPLTTGSQKRSHASSGPRPGTRWQTLLLAAIPLLSLSCVTITTSWTVTHREGQEDQVSVTMSRHLTEAYIEAARSANAARAQDYQAAGKDTADIFPDSVEKAREWLLADLAKLQNEGFQVVEDDRGFTAKADYTLTEFLGMHDEKSSVRLQVDQDRPEGIVYIFEIDLPQSRLTWKSSINCAHLGPLTNPMWTLAAPVR